MERNKKSTTIIGRKVSTLPTPVSTPSTASERTTSLVPNAFETRIGRGDDGSDAVPP